ncbi:uncharacterized protein LOC120417722 [Culex pipiens pallens]|uniref:uncharacterized protein LOC120417722 n=1 Tax=Culex pipiens pallens TaxID=42434 RepID=UPI001952D034|nr:uncharacterized protein LOC120417722 [Culex pipiens pallens]
MPAASLFISFDVSSAELFELTSGGVKFKLLSLRSSPNLMLDSNRKTVVVPTGGRVSTTPAIRSSPSGKTPARSLTVIDGERTPPASARTSLLIPRPVSQKKPTKRHSRIAPPPTKTSSETSVKVKPSILTSILEDEEVRCEESDPPPPPVEGAERNEQADDDREDDQEDLDRTLQQDHIANEINELNNVNPPAGVSTMSRSLETVIEDARCTVICKQKFMAAPVPAKPITSEVSIPVWVNYCSLFLVVLMFLLVAFLTACTIIVNYDHLMAFWDPSHAVQPPEVQPEELTGFDLLQRWLGELWQNIVNLVSTGKRFRK